MYLSDLIDTLHEKLKNEDSEVEYIIISRDEKTVLAHLEDLDIGSIYECLESKYDPTN